jgi:predicted dehydrogenase
MSKKPTRREFLGAAAATAALGFAAPRLYAADAKASPNDTINLGVIGCGARAREVVPRFKALPGNRVVMVCDVNSQRMNEVREGFGDGKATAAGDFRRVLDNKDVDAVFIATQAHWHVLPMVLALKAGKDVYLEKPLGNFIGEQIVAREAAKKYDRIVQIGTQQRSWEQYRKAVEVVQSGRLGVISEVKVWDYTNSLPSRGSPANCPPPKELDWDFYVGPSPSHDYNPNYYFNYGYDWYDFSGAGHQVAWGVHHFDIVNWAMGVTDPISAVAMGGKYAMPDDNRFWPDTFDGILEYGPGPVAKNGFVLQYTMRIGSRRDFRAHGKCFLGSSGSLFLDRAGYTITSEEREAGGKREKIIEEDTFRNDDDNHQQVFLEHVRNRTMPEANVETGHFATLSGHLLNLSYLAGRKILWDAKAQQAIGDPKANELIHREYRAPWKLEA